MTSNILGLMQVASGQVNEYATSNEADQQLENATQDFKVLDLSSDDVTVTAGEFNSFFLFRSSGNSVARNLNVPVQKRFFAVHNSGSATLSVVVGSTSLDVSSGDTGAFYADGTANGLVVLAGASGGSGISDIVDDASPQLGGDLDVNGNSIVSVSNEDINIIPNGTGNIALGNMTIDGDQAVGAGQDNYVLTYDHASGTARLESSSGGSASSDEYGVAEIDSVGVIDLSDSGKKSWVVNLDDDVTGITLPAAPSGETISLLIFFIQDGDGGHSVTGWPSVTWEGGGGEPSISSSANSVTSVPIIVFGDSVGIFGVSS